MRSQKTFYIITRRALSLCFECSVQFFWRLIERVRLLETYFHVIKGAVSSIYAYHNAVTADFFFPSSSPAFNRSKFMVTEKQYALVFPRGVSLHLYSFAYPSSCSAHVRLHMHTLKLDTVVWVTRR